MQEEAGVQAPYATGATNATGNQRIPEHVRESETARGRESPPDARAKFTLSMPQHLSLQGGKSKNARTCECARDPDVNDLGKDALLPHNATRGADQRIPELVRNDSGLGQGTRAICHKCHRCHNGKSKNPRTCAGMDGLVKRTSFPQMPHAGGGDVLKIY